MLCAACAVFGVPTQLKPTGGMALWQGSSAVHVCPKTNRRHAPEAGFPKQLKMGVVVRRILY